MTLTIVTLAPSLLNTNGDSENARVLACRAEWAGLEASVIPVESAADLPARIDAIIVGSGNDSSLERAREVLLGVQSNLRAWATEGVPILAVGTGWELLSWGIEFVDAAPVEGLGILPGRAVPHDGRITGDLVVSHPRFGVLVGFENHAREYCGAEGSPLGRVRTGHGNGRSSGQEGVVMGAVYGTHLHGPVLAKNPTFADHLLGLMCERAAVPYRPGERTRQADGYAADARAVLLGPG